MTDILLHGGRVHSPADEGATALLVRDGVIAWVGRDDGAPTAGGAVDLAGALVTPAFVDAHAHVTLTGLALTGLDLSGTRTLTDALDAVRRRCREHRGGIVLGSGWDETRWPERRPPTRLELDRATYGGVAYLGRVDGHSAVVSSALLAAAPDVRALRGFAESGWLRAEANTAVRTAALDTVGRGRRADLQRAALRHAAAQGVGCVHECGGPTLGEQDLTDLLALAGSEPLPEVVGFWGELGAGERARELGAVGAAGDLSVDGALGSRTASLGAAYADQPDTAGVAYLDREQVAEHVLGCVRAGVPAGFHAIGDAAIGAVVAGFSAAVRVVGTDAVRAGGHRIEHVELPDPQMIATMARLGITASVQPAFDAAWGGADGMYASRLGADRAAPMNPFAAFATAGVPLALGSDSPVTPIDPWAGVRAAVHHRTPGSGISAARAFAAHTVGGRRAAGDRSPAAGTLAVGAPATLAVWDVRPGADGPALPDLSAQAASPRCLRTLVRGVTVHDGEGALG